MHCHTHHSWHDQHIGEHRLCGFGPPLVPPPIPGGDGTGRDSLRRTYERVKANEAMEANTHIQEAVAFFDNDRSRKEFPDLFIGQSPERPYLLTLLTDGLLRDPDAPSGAVAPNAEYSSISRSNINIADPFGILDSYPDGKDVELGKFLRELLTPEILKQILKDGEKGGKATNMELGNAYRKLIVGNANLNFKASQKIDNQIFVQVSLQYYSHVRTEFRLRMQSAGVRPPTGEMEFIEDRFVNPGMDEHSMTKQEYALGMHKLLHGVKSTSDKGKIVPAFTGQIGAGPGGTDIAPYQEIKAFEDDVMMTDRGKRVSRVFGDVSLTRFGPTEALRRFNIEVGETARRNYVDARTGVSRGTDGITMPPEYVAPIPSAGEWINNPAIAHDFLKKNIPSTYGSSNWIFLNSLEYWAILQPAGKSVVDTMGKLPPELLMPENDLKAMLKLIVQEFTVYEDLMKKSNVQLGTLKKEVPTWQKVEEFVSNGFDYAFNFSDHPVGSIAMGLAFFMSIKALFGVMKKEDGLLTSPLGLGLLWAGAQGIYSKSTNGRAWWDGLFDKYDQIMGNEKIKNPQDRTLANYWERALLPIKGEGNEFDKLDREKERLTLGLVGQVEVAPMLGWYEQYQQYRDQSPQQQKEGAGLPPMPFKYGQYLNIYGQNATKKDVSEYIYLTMKKFFINRGQMAKRGRLQFDLGVTAMSEDEGIGFGYIREKYLKPARYYERLMDVAGLRRDIMINPVYLQLVSGEKSMTTEPEFIEAFGQVNGPIALQLWNDFKDRISKNDEQKRLYIVLLSRFQQMGSIETPTANYPMNHVFFMEGNPAAMARAASDPGDLSVWESMMNWFNSGAYTPPVAPVAAGSAAPTSAGGAAATPGPTAAPTSGPTAAPTPTGSAAPTVAPSAAPTTGPTAAPTPTGVAAPTVAPTAAPAPSPIAAPAPSSSGDPSNAPKVSPAPAPRPTSTTGPSPDPAVPAPGVRPSVAPAPNPAKAPSVDPSASAPAARPVSAPRPDPSSAPDARPASTSGPIPPEAPTPKP
ncbi:hypothetical protein FJZ28_00650 [Candidatus Peregrinibacteria bacterium]|nr:hypothetical protein [Candidatus Peregrinibacteria bacterium]